LKKEFAVINFLGNVTRYPERPIDDVIQCKITKGNIFEISFVDNEFGV